MRNSCKKEEIESSEEILSRIAKAYDDVIVLRMYVEKRIEIAQDILYGKWDSKTGQSVVARKEGGGEVVKAMSCVEECPVVKEAEKALRKAKIQREVGKRKVGSECELALSKLIYFSNVYILIVFKVKGEGEKGSFCNKRIRIKEKQCVVARKQE